MFGVSKKCAKCEKQVYPIEELKCLDKIWHKNCFKCTVCNSTLNMKNYKGFNKLPYCNVHYPRQKHTAVSDNPELLRIKENTKIQSNVKYHEDFEKSKGTYTVVADDPETRRILENSKIFSQVKYHEDFENMKNKNNIINPVVDATRDHQVIKNGVNYNNKEPHTRSNGDSYPTEIKVDHCASSSSNGRVYTANEIHQQQQQQQQQIPYNMNGQNYHHQQQQPQHMHSNGNENLMQTLNHFNNTEIVTSVYKAIYDYDGNEEDEISFRDGDKFINCEVIDVGWMIGVHEKTGKHGMFPSNYAEPVDLF